MADIIHDRVEAIAKAGDALLALRAIRDSTLPGTALAQACDDALGGVERVVGALYSVVIEDSVRLCGCRS
jgi:hypothetical protein